jgi:hypothetical protein
MGEVRNKRRTVSAPITNVSSEMPHKIKQPAAIENKDIQNS